MATRNDATGETVSFEFGDETYSVPPADAWDIGVLESLESGKTISALRSLVGDAEYARFRAAHSTVGDLKSFMQAASNAAGAGNS